ncbi:MAG: hypothetical protein OEY84_01195 [Rhodospirillaceae bacterium]|nr:hypothetical protein [Rhodospirillaceae bacterium]
MKKPNKKSDDGNIGDNPINDDASGKPSKTQSEWLLRAITQPGGKLPLFDKYGQKIGEGTVRSCIEKGWAEPWFSNPIKPDWLVCKITDAGRKAVS